MNNNQKNIRYFKLKKISTEFLLEFESMAEFHKFVDFHQLRSIFILKNEESEEAYFAVSYKGGLLQQNCMGFHTLEDYLISLQQNFPNAQSFYHAKEGGYASYQDYELVKECGINDKTQFDKMKAAGFTEGFKDYLTLDENLKKELGSFETPFQMYEDAIKNGFQEYKDFKQARSVGFHTKAIFEIANEKGYPTMNEYKLGSESGFLNYENFLFAKNHQIADYDDMIKFLDLQSLASKVVKSDEQVMLAMLSKLPQNKKVSINKIFQLFETSLSEYRYEGTQELPKWFTQAFDGNESIVAFLQNNIHCKAYGNYDTDGEYFETKQIQDRKVVIDGSNVAHRSVGATKIKPLYDNILLMIQELKRKGFTEISVISDAALKHKIGDPEKLPLIEEECKYLQAPAEIAADVFIINVVKNEHCLLVSNDTFREWKLTDPWIAQNIDYYRLKFMFTDDKIILPDLD